MLRLNKAQEDYRIIWTVDKFNSKDLRRIRLIADRAN